MSFLSLLEGAIDLDCFSFEPVMFTPTRVNEFEFFISLKTAPITIDKETFKLQQVTAIARMKEAVQKQKYIAELLA